jgi:4'-phosphopantetheinyl transferase
MTTTDDTGRAAPGAPEAGTATATAAAARPVVERPAVDLWLTDVASWSEAAARSVLDTGELERADRFVRESDRCRFVVAHAALRHVLASEVGTDPAALTFTPRACRGCGGPHGKPAVFGAGGRTGPEFNLSHSGDVVAIAVSVGPADGGSGGPGVGVDVQESGPLDHEALARRFYTSAERADVLARPAAASLDRFHQLWARKEAVLKATGEGIAGLDGVEVIDPPTAMTAARPGWGPAVPGVVELVVVLPDDGPVAVADVAAPPGYRAAVAVLGPVPPAVTIRTLRG